MPDVSVVMAVYNESIYVEAAIESVLSQRGPSIELIVIDDMSTDATYAIVERIAARDERVRLLRTPCKGKVNAFNFGVTIAAGDWTCIFAGDDIMPPDAMAARFDAVRTCRTDVATIGMCRLMTLSDDPRLTGQVIPRNPNKMTFSGVCYLMNRPAVAAMWPIPAQLPNEDTWLEMAAQYLDIAIVRTPVVGAHWRIHAGNSINWLESFDDFNRKRTARMVAPQVFLDTHRANLNAAAIEALSRRVRCEEARKRGSIVGIVCSGEPLVAKLRALSQSGPMFYWLRQRAYRLLSGW